MDINQFLPDQQFASDIKALEKYFKDRPKDKPSESPTDKTSSRVTARDLAAEHNLSTQATKKALEHGFEYGNRRDLASSSRAVLVQPSSAHPEEYIQAPWGLNAEHGKEVSFISVSRAQAQGMSREYHLLDPSELDANDQPMTVFYKPKPLSDDPMMASVLESLARSKFVLNSDIAFSRDGILTADYKLPDDINGSLTIDTNEYEGELFVFNKKGQDSSETLSPAAIKELLPVFLPPMQARTITKDWLEGKIPRE